MERQGEIAAAEDKAAVRAQVVEEVAGLVVEVAREKAVAAKAKAAAAMAAVEA